jgi:hypothetical protein
MDAFAKKTIFHLIDITNDDDDDDTGGGGAPSPTKLTKRLASYHGEPDDDDEKKKKKKRPRLIFEEDVRSARRTLAKTALPHLEAMRAHLDALLQIPGVTELTGDGLDDIAETMRAACDEARAGSA